MSGKKKRPGYQAGFNLVALDDPRTWERVERHSEEVIESIPNLREYEQSLQEFSTKQCFTKSELEKIITWKHTVGKSRPANRKLLEKNSDADVEQHTRSAISLARTLKMDECTNPDGSLSAAGKKAIQDVVACMDKLKGIGPAGASAAMSLVRPDLFCYFFDEVSDCFESQRDYKVANYLRINSRCLQIARKLDGEWSTSRVAKTIWVASRFLALHGEDLSSYMNPENDDADEDADDVGGKEKNDEKIESKQPQTKRLRSAKK
jgi:hypothetical protein